MFQEPTLEIADTLNVPFAGGGLTTIGLGGISEGWLPNVLLYQQTGLTNFKRIMLIDGKKFSAHNKGRQHFREPRNKAEERTALWSAAYPAVKLYGIGRYIDSTNIGMFIKEGAAVLLSPDNNATRVLVSRHVASLENALLIVGGNDGIDKDGGLDGSEGWVAVQCRVNGQNITPLVMAYHEDLLESGDKLPTQMSCVELAQAGQPQLLATNLFVGQMMSQLLFRYLTQPLRQAVEVVEVNVNSTTGNIGSYGIRERFVGTVFDG